MSPSAGIVQRLITVSTSRWFIAIMIPLPGITPTSSIPAMWRICAAHAPEALRTKPASMSMSSPVSSLRTRAPVTAPSDDVQIGDPVVGEDPRAVRGGAARERRDRLPRVDRRVGHGERAPDPRVEPRLAPERLVDPDLLRREVRLATPFHEPVAVGRVVVGRRDEQAAGVLDAVGDHLAQDRVLDDALVRRDRVLDDVAAAGVQQAVEAPARPLGEVAPLDEDDVEAAQRGVPRHAGAGRAASDHQHIGLDGWHCGHLMPRRAPAIRARRRRAPRRSARGRPGASRSDRRPAARRSARPCRRSRRGRVERRSLAASNGRS